jgi:hypothetical protein
MNREQIIQMAREAGSIDSDDVIETVFAAFSAAEREACAKECDELAGMLFCHGDKSGAEIAVSLRDTIRARGKTT